MTKIIDPLWYKRPEKCKGYQTVEGDYDCGYDLGYAGGIMCEDCIYGPYPDENSLDPKTGKVATKDDRRNTIDYLCQCGHPKSAHVGLYRCTGREYQIYGNFTPPIEKSIPCRCAGFRIGDRRYHDV